ncbi:MAG: low molecular weight phosphotyrosine protein phosphatase [Clostridia bacterium]|nr:low molecular weight phosphotyrosine protein phosphatase [Clostridia bacterium]
MISVCFVCLGNICRSPMGELILKKMVKERGIALSFEITSRGTEAEEGCHVYRKAKAKLEEHGVEGDHIARQLTRADVLNNDYILVMDSSNLFDVLRISGGNFGDRVYKLCAFTNRPRDIADPWYTGDFDRAYEDICDGCERFLDFITMEHAEALDYDKRH